MFKMFKVLFVLAMILFVVACEVSGPYDLENETELVVGLEAAYAPFNWSTPNENEFTIPILGQQGVYADGFDIVMASHIANHLGKNLVIRAIDWDGLIPALLSKEIDLIIAGMSPTEERALTVSFSDPYFRSEQVMVVRRDGDYQNATSLADFEGASVVAQLGTLQNDLIEQIPNVVHLAPLSNYQALAVAVSSQAADAFVAELPVALGLVQSNPTVYQMIQFAEGLGFDVDETDVNVSVALRQEDSALLNAINEALQLISDTVRNDWMAQALERQPSES
jgi:ABC-type amino acid transport substrate-binding protein